METDTLITPERTTLKAVATLVAFFLAVSTLNPACIALFDCQHIKQTVNFKVCWQSVKISVSRDPNRFSALRAFYFIPETTRLLNSAQAMETKAVQARQLLWICEPAHTHRTTNFLMKIVQQGLNIHDKRQRFRLEHTLHNSQVVTNKA